MFMLAALALPTTSCRVFVELDTTDSEADADNNGGSSRGGSGKDRGKGNLVSLWDLYRYVHHNPELEALAKSHR